MTTACTESTQCSDGESFKFATPWHLVELTQFQEQKRRIVSELSAVHDLSMINPDLPPARILTDKLVEFALRAGQHRYAVARGTNFLRTAFANKYEQKFNVILDPEQQICVSMGCKDACLQTLQTVFSLGSKALIATPSYPAHLATLKMIGYQVSFFNCANSEAETFQNLINRAEQVKPQVILLSFPNNPTGNLVSKSFWKELNTWASKNSCLVINDFTYGEMSFTAQAESALSNNSANQSVVEIYSLSKAYSVPGWRVGALMGNRELVNAISSRKSYVDYGIFLPLQHTAAFALNSDENLVQPLLRRYEQRARVLSSGLKKLGWQVSIPQAGCSVWAKAPEHLQASGLALAEHFMQKGVIGLPGIVFGQEYANYLRFALVEDEERLLKVLELMAEN